MCTFWSTPFYTFFLNFFLTIFKALNWELFGAPAQIYIFTLYPGPKFTHDQIYLGPKFTHHQIYSRPKFTRVYTCVHNIKFTRNPNLHKKFTQHQICTDPNLHKHQIYTGPKLTQTQFHTKATFTHERAYWNCTLVKIVNTVQKRWSPRNVTILSACAVVC